MLNIINAIFGGTLLAAGRKLFWFFVGVVGFIAGFQLASRVWHGPEGTAIIVGLVVGIIFAVLAVFVQAIAIGVAGFIAGAYILGILAAMIGLDKGPLLWVIYIVGGIIGVATTGYLFDWALIALSSLAGASLLVEALHLQRLAGGAMFFILVILGVAIQASTFRSERHDKSNH